MKRNFTRKHILATLVCVALVVCGFIAGWFFGDSVFGAKNRVHEMREGGYEFINPLLECGSFGAEGGERELRPFKTKVREYIDGRLDGTRIQHVSVYFRDLNNGPWFGVNEQENYSPASLLKVVTMISCLKQAENDPAFLTRKVLYPKGGDDANVYENIKPARSIKPGSSYTVEELLEMMVVYSDNNAKQLLIGTQDRFLFEKTYHALGLDLQGNQVSLEDFMSVATFASTFRVLFNASYLSRAMSEKALGLLSRVDFRDGLVAGVPSGVVVAHKFGERVLGGLHEIKQLHDCGIVYYPDEPYLLCVMSRGNSFELLDEVIRDVSRIVFEEIYLQHRK